MARKLIGTAQRIVSRAQAEEGQGMAEFGLILALIAVVCIGGFTLFGEVIAESAGFVALPEALGG